MTGATVAKIGGSLFDLPDLRARVVDWVSLRSGPVLLVPGGGPAADLVRDLDRWHGLGEAASHWLALRVLALNAQFLSLLLGAPVVAGDPAEWLRGAAPGCCPDGARTAILDAHAFCTADESHADRLPHTWRVTSDSVAARVAAVIGADLVLLKSRDLPPGWTWPQAAAAGLVDEEFPDLAERYRLLAAWVNLRRPAR